MLNFLFTKTPLMFFYQSLWRDEAFSFVLSQKNIGELLIATAKDFNPPLYYLVLKFWVLLFGKSEVALRSLSLIFFWLMLYVIYLLLINVYKFSWKKSYFYLLLIVINPLLVYYAFEVRMYSLLAFLAALSFYALLTKKKRLYLIATVAGLYTHYFFVFLILGEILYLLLTNKRKDWWKFLKQYLIIGGLFLPWLIFFLVNKDIQTANDFWILKKSLPSLIDLPGYIYTGYEKNFLFFEKNITNLSLALILTIGFAFLKNYFFKKKHQQFVIALIVWGILIPVFVLVISYFKPIFLPRYLIFATVGLLLLLIYALDQFHLLLRLIILVPLFLVTVNYHKLQLKERKKADLRKVIGEISRLAKKNDLLLVTNELDYFTAEYYFDANRVFIYGKTYEEIPAYVGKVLIPEEKITAHFPRYPQKAFILNLDYSYSIQAEF